MNAWAFLSYWGARARAAHPQVYAYANENLVEFWKGQQQNFPEP